MGCGSSVGQVIDSKEGIFKLEQILCMNQHKQDNIAQGKLYLFGETRTHRKIIECEAKLNTVKTISSKTRIPCPKINLDPLETMYEQSQEIFHLGIYGFNSLPPFNKMLALYLQTNIIFMCGGRDYDHYNVKNQVFFYSVQDLKIMSQMTSNINELSPRRLSRPKYARNRFQKMASMGKKRYAHMGIYCNKLKSVLVFGGRNENEEILASCEIYSILENTWRDLPSMKVPRADGHCFEYAGKVYLFGGRSNQVKLSKKIEVFSPQDLTWSLLTFKIHRGIENGLIFSQNPNEVLIVGGKSHFYSCKTVIKIDLRERTYVWDSELSREYDHPKGLKIDEDLIIFGGQKDTCQIFKKKWRRGLFTHRKSVELDELQEFSFTQESLVIKATQSNHEKNACLQEETVFFGTDEYPCIALFNRQTGKIRKRPVPMSLRLKKNMQNVQLPKKVYMLLGGSDREEKKLSRSCFIYDSHTNTAVESLKMTEKKINFAVVYYQNEVYTFGGYNPVQNTGYVSCQKYNIEQQKWIDICRLVKPKYKTFAQKISPNKIAVFGHSTKHQPVKQISIYHTKGDYYDSFALQDQISGRIPMVYCVEEENKIIILREGTDNILQQIEITQEKLRQKKQQPQQLKTIQYILQSMKIVHTAQNEPCELIIKSSRQKTESQESAKQQLNTNIIAVKPKMIEIKPLVCEQQEQRVKTQGQQYDSFKVQKIQIQNKIAIQSLGSDRNLLGQSEKQMPQNPIEDDVYFSIDTHSLQANFTNHRFKETNTYPKQHENTFQHLKEEKTEQPRSLKHIKQLQILNKQKHNILKRQNHLYILSQTEIILFNPSKHDKTAHKIQLQHPLKLFHLA